MVSVAVKTVLAGKGACPIDKVSRSMSLYIIYRSMHLSAVKVTLTAATRSVW